MGGGKSMLKTIKVMLLPNNRQESKLFKCAGTARFVYNWAVNLEERVTKPEADF